MVHYARAGVKGAPDIDMFKLTGTSARRQDTGGQVAEVGGVPVPPTHPLIVSWAAAARTHPPPRHESVNFALKVHQTKLQVLLQALCFQVDSCN